MNLRWKRSIRKNLVGYSFIIPAVIGFLMFMAYPLFNSLYLSFMDWNMFKGAAGSTFIGLDNYKEVFQNEYFRSGLLHNLLLMIMGVPLLIVLALVIANLLNAKIFGRGLLRAVYFVPYITTITASALVFSALFHPEFGPINSFLRSLGIESTPGWATSVKWALPTIALFWVWKNVGYCTVIYLASLQGISKSYYEAASIDGANKLQQFFHITVPISSPTTFFLIITSVISSFQVFAEVQVMTQGGPGTASMTIVYHIYDTAFKQYHMGYASAVSWVFFVLVVIITLIQWIGQKKWVKYV
ncbi:carbohydrate ABC transporter permease [Paenibacillus agaridevorans]|uniref:carbohydrate ABC transporter permease n=1 Tax=Paenibacillus agaridevorans TaxID=171404 RepID=UPI001BE45472|nr:sugar ABC transporter permease [Paenibacillus agaridevorans]